MTVPVYIEPNICFQTSVHFVVVYENPYIRTSHALCSPYVSINLKHRSGIPHALGTFPAPGSIGAFDLILSHCGVGHLTGNPWGI